MESLAICKQAYQQGISFNNIILPNNIDNPVKNLEFKSLDINHAYLILDEIYKYYVNKQIHNYTAKDYKDIKKWINNVFTYRDGIYNPLNLKIVAPESPFEFIIDEPWAKYSYKDTTDRPIEGQLGIKGTIDLTTEISNDVFELIDWKSGACKDWKVNKPHDYKSLSNSFQLHLYHYSIMKMYPKLKQVVVTINYVATNEYFTFAFDRNNLDNTVDMIKSQFLKIQKDKNPRLLNTFFCDRICWANKQAYKPEILNPKTNIPYTICKYINNSIRNKGLDATTMLETKSGFKLGFYQEPGV